MASNVVVTYDFVQGTPANADDVDTNFSDITTWINTNAAHLDGTKSFTGMVTLPATDPSVGNHATRKAYVDAQIAKPLLDYARENWVITAAAATGTINVDVQTAAISYYTVDATANWTINLRGDGSTTLSSLLAVGDSVTAVMAAAQGATPYYPNVVQVDGVTVTPKWLNVAPAAGTANAVDVYTFVVVKTASSPTYTVFGSKASFV